MTEQYFVLAFGSAEAAVIPRGIFLGKAILCGHYETRAFVHAQSSCLCFCWSSAISATFNSSLRSHLTRGIARFDPHCNLCPRARGFNNAAESTSKRNVGHNPCDDSRQPKHVQRAHGETKGQGRAKGSPSSSKREQGRPGRGRLNVRQSNGEEVGMHPLARV